jgi:5-hydroxyisourate hydrolase-like protein (transthyretin family)
MLLTTEEIVPTEFELGQNYPNPFKEKTTIKYCVPETIKLRLEVFDSKGNKVKTLVDGTKEAGTHKVEFNAENFESGEYLYKLESKDYFESKSMVVLK